MHFSSELLKEHTKENMSNIANWIGNDKKKFAQLIEIFIHGEKRTSQMAGWVLTV